MNGKPTEAIPPHRILREVFRHYTEYKQYVSDTGKHIIEHGYWVYDDKGEKRRKINISVSFWDLVGALKEQKKGGILSDRKREAMFYNVILDWKQRDVADKMGITTVSVGQYVEQACLQLGKHYFAELYDQCEECEDDHTRYECEYVNDWKTS